MHERCLFSDPADLIQCTPHLSRRIAQDGKKKAESGPGNFG
jgi:hypothetical protein